MVPLRRNSIARLINSRSWFALANLNPSSPTFKNYFAAFTPCSSVCASDSISETRISGTAGGRLSWVRSNVYPNDLKILGRSNVSEPAVAANYFWKLALAVLIDPLCDVDELAAEIPKVAIAFAFHVSPSGNR